MSFCAIPTQGKGIKTILNLEYRLKVGVARTRFSAKLRLLHNTQKNRTY